MADRGRFSGGTGLTDGRLADELDALTPKAPVTETGTTRRLSAADANGTIICTNAAGCLVTVDHSLKVGFACLVVQDSAGGTVTLDDDGAATTFVAPASATAPPKTLEAGSTIGIQMIAAGKALVYGSLG